MISLLNLPLDPVTIMGQLFFRRAVIMMAEPVGRFLVIAVRRTIARPFPRFDRILASVEIKIERWARVKEIDRAKARGTVETFGFVSDRVYEYLDPFDLVLDRENGLTLVPNQTRIKRQLAEYGEAVPEHTLDRFTTQYPLCNRDDKYNKQVLVAWLEEYQRKWDIMLDQRRLDCGGPLERVVQCVDMGCTGTTIR